MIRSFRHKGLKRLYERGVASGVPPDQVAKVRRILSALDAAQRPSDLDLPGYALHPLKGDRKGEWAVRVTRSWRVIFRIVDGDVRDVDLLDYH